MMITQQNKAIEISYSTIRIYKDPFNEVCVSARVTDPDGIVRRIPAFWAGNGTWKFRYSSGKIGMHRYVTECTDGQNIDLEGKTGDIRVEQYVGDNMLLRHGTLHRRGNDLYLTHMDGTPFFWLGDTWWMSLTTRLSWPDGFKTLTADRVAKGFNVVQIVAGLYPDMIPFDERGTNEAGFPWDMEYKSINPAYFNAADNKIGWLVENGIVPCIVGSWGFFMQSAGKETIKRHWKNIIARWGAYPVVWCLAGEANMAFYDNESTSIDEHLKKSRKDWNDIARFVHENDPFERLVTIHPTNNGHEQIDDEKLLGLDMLQTGHNSVLSIVPNMKQMKQAVDRNKLPVINAEACYEGICNSSYDDVQRYLFWMNIMLGACGHTYGANGIWQLNTLDKPYGLSPHGAHWGNTPWEKAYQLPGSFQIGEAKKLWCRFEWWRFENHPEWIDNPCSGQAMDGCYAVGIPEKVRIIFRPFWGGYSNGAPIRHIEQGIRYNAFYFNPVTGEETGLGVVTPDETGSWVSPHVNAIQDWVIVLYA